MTVPPDPVPVDFGVTPAELAQALRTRVTTDNEPTLQNAIYAAAQEADNSLDSLDQAHLDAAHGSALGHEVVLQRAVEWYKAADAAFGVVGFSDVGALRAPGDGFARHAAALLPLRDHFGLA